MNLKQLVSSYKEKYEGLKLNVSEAANRKYINIDLIVIPSDFRGNGIGQEIVEQIIKYAQINGSTICLTPASKDDFETFGINKVGLKKFWSKEFFGQKFVTNTGKNKDYEISASMYMEIEKQEKTNEEKLKREKKTLSFIENVLKNDVLENVYHSSIQDKYLNGECDSLVGYLYQINKTGNAVEICMREDDEWAEDEEKIFHSVYELDGAYYDINGKFSTIEDLLMQVDYYDESMIVELREWEIKEENYYPAIPMHLRKKENNSPKGMER